jgi:hypothetical protein
MSEFTPHFAPVVVLFFLACDWLSLLIVGHESSFLHKKIHLGLDPAPAPSSRTVS